MQKAKHDFHAKVRTFHPYDPVYALHYQGNTERWILGTIDQHTGPVSYTVRSEDDAAVRRHINQLQEQLSSSQVVSPGLPVSLEMTFPHEGAESPDESQASQPVSLFTSEDVRTKSTN